MALVPLWAKWKKTTGKNLQHLVGTDTSGLLALVSVGKGAEKGVQINGDVVGIALSVLFDARWGKTSRDVVSRRLRTM